MRKVSTKFEVDMTIRCLVIALLLLIRCVTLWPWLLTFWPWSMIVPGGSRGQPLHQVWRSYAIRSWVMSSVWHLPYTIDNEFAATGDCACAVSRDLCVGANFPTYLKSLTPICLFTIQLLWRCDDVWGLFTLSTSNVKDVFRPKISKYRRNLAPKWRFWRKMACKC